MEIALFADIHGNIDALNAAIKHAKDLKITKFITLGDYVGYYHKPYEVIEALLKLDPIMIKGNHEDFLFKAIENKDFLQELNKKYGHGHEIAMKELKDKHLKILKDLPMKKSIKLPNNDLMLICHGSPSDINEYIYPDSSLVKIKKALNKFNYVACGHSHYQFIIRTAPNKFLFNPGSIGQPRERGKKGACWASFNLGTKKVKFFNTEYNRHSVIQTSKNIDKDVPYLYEVLRR